MKYMMMMMKVQKKKGLRREFSSEGLLEYQKAYACRDEVAVRKGYKKGRWREHENSWKHIRLQLILLHGRNYDQDFEK